MSLWKSMLQTAQDIDIFGNNNNYLHLLKKDSCSWQRIAIFSTGQNIMSRDEVDRILRELILQEPPKNCPKAPPLIIQPRCHKAKVSIWVDVQMKDANQIKDAASIEELQKKLAEIFGLDGYKENKRCAILMDLYTYVATFAKENCFNAEQISVIFSIFKQTHDVCTETPFGNFEHCFQFFKEMVICHSVRRPPFSIDLFSPQEAKKILEYGINSYFRHYKLYKFVFTQKVTLDLKLNYEGVPLTPPPERDATEVPEEMAGGPQKDQETEDGAGKLPEPEVTSELKSLIRKHLAEELRQIKVKVEEQIKQTEEEIGKRLETSEIGKLLEKTENKPSAKEKKPKAQQ